jgi:hypothetical protein
MATREEDGDVLLNGAVEIAGAATLDGVLGVTGLLTASGFIANPGGIKVQSSDLVKNANVTLADAPGLSVTLVAGKTYILRAVLYVTVDSNAGAKFAFGGTCTVTSMLAEVLGISNTQNDLAFALKATAKTLGGQQSAGQGTDWTVYIDATLVINAGGTLTLQFAQQVSFAANCTQKALSTMEVRQVA